MEKKLTFQSPKTIYFGKDTLADIKKEGSILGEKVLLITDQVMQDLGYVESLEKCLNPSQVRLVIYDAIDSEPTDQHVYEAVKLFKGEHCDAVVSLGGGSCIDAAKAVSILVTNDLKVEDLLHHQDAIKHPPVPHIAIPTTAGTGSEVTDVIVITHLESMVKMMMKHPFFIPQVAIIDPLLTVSCPPSVVAGTGVDAF